MKIEEYITELRDAQTSLEGDAETLERLADELQEILDGFEAADGFYEITDALNEFDGLTSDTEDLMVADLTPLINGWDTEAWKDELAQTIKRSE